MNRRPTLLILFVLTALPLAAQVILPNLLADQMVLQQNDEVKLWGKATPGKTVQITPSWSNKVVTTHAAADSSWSVTVRTPSADGVEHTLRFVQGKSTTTLSGVLLGEVWLCSGQSNMEMPMRGFPGQPVTDAHRYIASAHVATPIRFYSIPRASSKELQEELPGRWSEHSPQEVANFSAVAYHFGRQLHETLGVPIGLINASWGSSHLETWMSRSALNSFEEFDIEKLYATPDAEIKFPNRNPTLLYNAMIHPLRHLSIKGVIWYQGESNVEKPDLYEALFNRFAESWRELFRTPELPIYTTQLAPFKAGDTEGLTWPLFRERQLKLMSELPHTGMAFTSDLGSAGFIHPPRKQQVGERLAFWALAKSYGIKGITHCGPILKEHKREENRFILTFEEAPNGLMGNNLQVSGFEVLGSDGQLYAAKARLKYMTRDVEVWCEAEVEIKEIRYLYKNYAEGNLSNTEGLPAAPFRLVIE